MGQNNLNSDDRSVESPSADERTEQTDVRIESPHQKTDNGDKIQSVINGHDQSVQETGPKKEERKNNGSEDEHNRKSKPEPEPKHMMTEDKGGLSNAEGTKRLNEALKEIQDQDTHALYCPKCFLDITKNAKLFEKEKEPSPYNQKNFVLWVPFVFPFSFLWQWRTGNLPEEADSIQPTVVNTQDQNPSLLGKKSLTFLLVVVLPLLLVIVLWALPSSKRRVNNKSGLTSLPWPIHFPTIKYLPVISLFFLAILALAWWLKTGSMPSPTAILKVLIDMLRKYMVAPVQQLSSIKLDILKSIVYGGLIESITSLGVVSSAAGSGASTLNVMALGLANLFSGFFLISHNLRVLLWRPPYQGENHDHMPNLEAKDHQYEILLGKKDKALLHWVVVLVSLLIFAVIPPLLYGFSFKIIDKEHSKAAVVLAASMFCVISLSFAKAYAFSMDKLKTMAEYTGIAIVSSALSFIAGQYFIDVLGKYDLH